MRPSLRFLMFCTALLILSATDEAAQTQAITPAQSPRVEVFGGYSYMRANAVFTGSRINLNGATFATAFYVNHWLAVVADVGIYHAGNIANQFSLTLTSYQAGPRVRLRTDTRFTPYGQFLVGGGHAGGTIYTKSLGFGIAPIGANNSFLFTLGGGADLKLSRRISLRLVQAEYLHSEFLNGSTIGHQQNNMRLSAGAVFNFGNN